jgi:hypothetical protein
MTMKRWIPALLAVVVIALVCVFLVARRNAPEEPQHTEKQTEDTKTQQDDGSFHGLQIGLPEDFRQQETDDTAVVYSNGKYKVLISYQENPAGDDAMALREAHKAVLDADFNNGDYWEIGSGKTEETPYAYSISMDETKATVAAFYATDASAWTVEVTNIEEGYELDPMIFLIVGWEYRDPEVK